MVGRGRIVIGCGDAGRAASLARAVSSRGLTVAQHWPLERALLAGHDQETALVVLDGYPSSLDLRVMADVTAAREDLTVLAYRFAGDAYCRAERFAAYERALGDRFVGRVLPDACANPNAPMKNPHSVVTLHLIDRDGEPTAKARDEILDFFRTRLS